MPGFTIHTGKIRGICTSKGGCLSPDAYLSAEVFPNAGQQEEGLFACLHLSQILGSPNLCWPYFGIHFTRGTMS